MASVPEYTKVTVADGTTTVADSDHNLQEDQIVLLSDAIRVLAAKGSLLVATAQGEVIQLTVGANNKALLAASAETGGIKWGDILIPSNNLSDVSNAATARGNLGAGTGDGDLLAANNLSDVSTAATARTNLGLAIGSDVQGFHAYLADIAGITAAQGDIIYFNGSDWVNLGFGTSGYFLKTQGTGANPVWAEASGGGGAMALISETVLGSSASSISFTSIPDTYRHLLLKLQLRSDRAFATDPFLIRLNGDTGNNYDALILQDTSSSTARTPTRAAAQIFAGTNEAAQATANAFSPCEVNFFNYKNTSFFKYILTRDYVREDASADTDLKASWISANWNSTAAITTILIYPGSGPNFVTGSIAALYGIT